MEKIDFSLFKRDLLKNSTLVSLRYAIVAAVGLAVSLAFARHAPKEVFGQYQFVLSLFSFFAIFSLPGLNVAALKSVSRGEGAGVVRQAVRLSFLWSLAAVPLLVGYGSYMLLSGGSNVPVGWACILFGIFFPLLNAPNTWYAYYEGRLQFLPVTIRVIGLTIASAAFLFAGLWNQLNVLFLVAIWFSTSIVGSWLFYWEIVRKENRDTKEPGKLDVSYGFKVTLQKFVVGLTENVPIIAISTFLGFEAVANFQVASVFVGAVAGLLGALIAMGLPVIFSSNEKKHPQLLFYSILSGIIASAGYALLVETLFLSMYGVQYQESFELARLLIPLPFLVSIRVYFMNIFTAREENGRIISTYLVANGIAALLFLISTDQGLNFVMSAGIYLYALNFLLIFPLARRYFSKAF